MPSSAKVRVLPADVSRCNGIVVDGEPKCPLKDTCMRYLSPPHKLQWWVSPTCGHEQVRLDGCELHWNSQ